MTFPSIDFVSSPAKDDRVKVGDQFRPRSIPADRLCTRCASAPIDAKKSDRFCLWCRLTPEVAA